MSEAQVRAQTILYRNGWESVLRSIDSINNAVRVSKAENGFVNFVEIAFGDASPEPLIDNAEIERLNALYGENLKISYTFFGFNSGTSRGQNILFRDCTAPYFMAYNPDIVVCPRYFLEMMKFYADGDGDTGMVEARQTPLEHPKKYNEKTFEEKWGAMACVIIPSAVYGALGGLDEKTFFLYCDDVDFSWRLRLNGKKIYYCHAAPVYHGHTLNKEGILNASEAEKYYSAEAALLMAYKWSNNPLLKKLLFLFKRGSDYQKKAVESFNKMKAEGKLPEQLDKDHKIASFTGFNYSENRYN